MSEDLVLATPTDALLGWLSKAIEALSDRKPEFSKGPRSRKGISHTTFCNGFEKNEGDMIVGQGLPLEDRVQRTLDSVKQLRNQIDGPARLTWRILPEITEHDDLYVRLSFDHCNRMKVGTTDV